MGNIVTKPIKPKFTITLVEHSSKKSSEMTDYTISPQEYLDDNYPNITLLTDEEVILHVLNLACNHVIEEALSRLQTGCSNPHSYNIDERNWVYPMYTYTAFVFLNGIKHLSIRYKEEAPEFPAKRITRYSGYIPLYECTQFCTPDNPSDVELQVIGSIKNRFEEWQTKWISDAILVVNKENEERIQREHEECKEKELQLLKELQEKYYPNL